MQIPCCRSLRKTLVLLAAGAILCACSAPPSAPNPRRHIAPPRIARIGTAARTWNLRAQTTAPAALMLLRDGAPFERLDLSVARSIQRSNPRIDPLDAVYLADKAIASARAANVDPAFFCAMILQESAFDPNALSVAGAVGIAQFTLETADASGVDPFEPESALAGAAQLIGDYLKQYRGVYADPYAAALAAYNAGPQAVATYHGVPPYQETQQYIGFVYERWALLLSDTSTPLSAGYVK
ncbi:MAG: lytic transglycosylase domain-containing protein, partial [Candidatus Eremiobacteraeota bacterium]|nr:lytic transglycosylase domain-containing protein [Candidatus Eremiobacteraeota bacterium]